MKLDQCLFGYEDGHRLLASSIPLGDQTSSLTQLSDLAPGTVFGSSDGYWTGVPAPEIGRYALMRTWPAPEMSRPGCVWTHGLLLEPSMLETVSNLAVLASLARRPIRLADRSSYREAIEFDLARLAVEPDLVEEAIARDLIEVLYGPADRAVGVSVPGEADSALFAIWSQQWPRLRRNIRFQTAATRDFRPPSAKRLDISMSIVEAPIQPSSVTGPEAIWIGAACADLQTGADGEVRAFLWRYGQGVKRQRGSFRPLVKIKVIHDGFQSDAGRQLLEIVSTAFPENSDAAQLKQDLVDGIIAPRAQVDFLWYIMTEGGEAALPSPTQAGISRLALLWPERPNELLELAESIAVDGGALGQRIFQTISEAVPVDAFWPLTIKYPRVRERMVKARPRLIETVEVESLDNASLAELVELIPIESGMSADFIARLLGRDDTRLAEATLTRFPREATVAVISTADATNTVGRAWLRALVRHPITLLDASIFNLISRANLLFEIAETLGWLTADVIRAGCAPWAASHADISSGLPDDRRDTLRAFLVALALSAGGESGQRLLEDHFGAVHTQVMKSRLPWRARDMLAPLMPDIGWMRGWDLGLRLRLALADAYIRFGYPPRSFASLGKGRKERALLAEAAATIPGGRELARAAEE